MARTRVGMSADWRTRVRRRSWGSGSVTNTPTSRSRATEVDTWLCGNPVRRMISTIELPGFSNTSIITARTLVGSWWKPDFGIALSPIFISSRPSRNNSRPSMATEHLAAHYTVVTYDRRGLSRSVIEDPGKAMSIATHSEDVHHLLNALTTEPAFVFGTSIGALIGLDLLARYPRQVRLLIAHEPPAAQVLPEDEWVEARRIQRMIEQGSRGREWKEAMRKIAVDHSDREPGVEIPAPADQARANAAFFRANDAPAAHRYELDLDALRAASDRLVTAGGEKSRPAFPYRCAAALAAAVGIEFFELPGDHAGYATRPASFAAALAAVLDGTADRAEVL
jgi:pimeloyl-ACP methyl ester carboxylesterase